MVRTPPTHEERLAAAPLLREVIADVRKVVRELVAEKDHRDDDRDRDDRDDECVLDKSLAFFALKKLDHARSFHGAAAAANGRK
jgi:predicted metal-dependent HD superfamily phosphohydrolase